VGAVRADGHKLKEIKGKAVISINDHPAIRECFKDFEMEALKLDYRLAVARTVWSVASW
jgi:hypothetical protein